MLIYAILSLNVIKLKPRGYTPAVKKEMVYASDEDATADVMETHDQFVSCMQSRLAKLQVFFYRVILLDTKKLFGSSEAWMLGKLLSFDTWKTIVWF